MLNNITAQTFHGMDKENYSKSLVVWIYAVQYMEQIAYLLGGNSTPKIIPAYLPSIFLQYDSLILGALTEEFI